MKCTDIECDPSEVLSQCHNSAPAAAVEWTQFPSSVYITHYVIIKAFILNNFLLFSVIVIISIGDTPHQYSSYSLQLHKCGLTVDSSKFSTEVSSEMVVSD